MLEFASAWSWWMKALIAVAFMAPVSILVVFFGKRYNLSSEAFFLAWLVGSALAFVWFAATSSTIAVASVFRPLGPFLAVVVLGVLLGGIANVLVAQSIPQAPNPALPWGIIAVNTPIAYICAVLFSSLAPRLFPPVSFSAINLLGIFVLVIGIIMTMYRPS